MAYVVARYTAEIPFPADTVLVDQPIYQYQILEQLADCARSIGRMDEARQICRQLLGKPLPKEERKKIQAFLNQLAINRRD